MSEYGRKKILFLVEAVSAAHLIRVLPLAESIADKFDITIAAKDTPAAIINEFKKIEFINLETTVPTSEFLASLHRGKLPYDDKRIRIQVNEDFKTFDLIKPDLVVVDFRLSASLSAAERKLPVFNISNAFWSPEYTHKNPIPDIPLVRLFGYKFISILSNLIGNKIKVEDTIMRANLAPFNRLRLEFGLAPFGSLKDLYSFGTVLLHPDPMELFDNYRDFSSNFIGPITYVPNAPEPSWLNNLNIDLPTIYLSMGSSGQSSKLKKLIPDLIQLPYQWIILSNDTAILSLKGKNLFTACFAPLEKLAKYVDLAITNGGSAQGYFFLSKAIPVLGIPSNLDQHLFMQALEKHMLAYSIRSDGLSLKAISRLIAKALHDQKLHNDVLNFSKKTKVYNPKETFSIAVKNFFLTV